VPLTATATGRHVEVASSYSKSVLRSVCGALQEDYKDVDYFPSYEIITSQTARGENFAPNMRSVTSDGVKRAMGLFMEMHDRPIKGGAAPAPTKTDNAERQARNDNDDGDDDVVCEEALLEAFAK